jgi:hypothetical protein
MRAAKLLLLRPSLEQQVRNLFRMGEGGAWYDPSDILLMYQDSAGITPAAIGSPVGLFLDKRGLALGAEVLANGTFSQPATAWSEPAGAVISGGKMNFTAVTTFSSQDLAGLAAGYYEFTVVVDSVTSGTFDVELGGGIGSDYVISAAGQHTFRRYWPGVDAHIYINPQTSPVTAVIDSVSLRAISCNHAVQAGGTAQPNLAAGFKIDYDGVNDELVTTWASALGSNCTVGRAVAGTGASILTGQTIGTTYTDNTDHCGLVIIDRALSPQETLGLTRYLNRKAGL